MSIGASELRPLETSERYTQNNEYGSVLQFLSFSGAIKRGMTKSGDKHITQFHITDKSKPTVGFD